MDPTRYDDLWNNLAEFTEKRCGAVDEKALRIVCAACWNHLFTADRPISLWIQGLPMGFPVALGALGQPLWRPVPGMLAQRVKAQATADKSLWSVQGAETIFGRRQEEVRRLLELFAGIDQGHVEWIPGPTKVDKLLGWVKPFIWNGRITLLLSSLLPLNPMQRKMCLRFWPMVQNSFATVRFRVLSDRAADRLDVYRPMTQETMKDLAALFARLMDATARDRKHRAIEPADLFSQIPWMQPIITALRGPAFDAQALALKAIQTGMAHASMMGKIEADQEDFGLARKMMIDSIPAAAATVLRAIPLDRTWTVSEVAAILNADFRIVQKFVDRMVATGAVKKTIRKKTYSVSYEMQRALVAGF